MKSIIEKTIAALMLVFAASGAWAATYMMSNANGSAMQWDGGYTWNSGAISFNLSNPSGIAANGDFPTSGKVALTCISISSRKDAGNSIALDHVVLTAANGRKYTSSRVEVSSTPFTTTLAAGGTYNDAGNYGKGGGRYTINIYFDSIEVDVTSPLTIATYTSATATGTLGTSVVRATSGSGSWYAAMRIYGTSIDTATTSTPVLLVDANGEGNGTAADPNTVEWLGLATGNSQSATQGDARLAVTIGAGNLWSNDITDSFDAQEGTFLAPSATVVTPEAFSASALDEVVAELGLDATQTDGLSTALSKGLYNGQGSAKTQTVAISGLTTGQNYTLYLAASGFTYSDNAQVTPYISLTGYATGTTPVVGRAGASETGWTESTSLNATGTAGKLTLFRIRNLYPDSSGQVTLALSDGTHAHAGFNMVALAKTKTPKCAAVVGVVKAFSSIAIDSSNLVSGFPISSATIGEGALIQSGSVVIGNSGMTLDFTSDVKPRFTAFVKASNLPVSSGRLISWSSGADAPFVQKTATGFEQKSLNESNGNVASGSYGTGAWTHDAGEHWLAVVHNRADGAGDYETGGTYTYIDGERICSSTGLKWGGYTFKSITIGGAKVNDADVANGMSVSKVYLCSEALTQAQMATVTAALNKGWTIAESTGLVLAGTNVELPDSTETVTAKIWINADGTYSFVKSGSIPSSDLHSSGGIALPSAVTVDDEAGLICANDGSVIIRDAGIQIPLAETLPYLTVMMKVSNIPSSASRLLGWAIDYKSVSGSLENFLSYTGTQFEQHYYYNTGVAQTTYGNSAWTRDANEHWIATTYVPNNSMDGCSQTTRGTRTYLDGTQIIENTGFYFTDAQTSKILIGGLSLNGGNPATGMVVKDVMILADALTSAQIATVTAALNKGWAPVNAAGTTLSGTNLELPDSTARLTGTISIASDGSYSVSVSSGTTTLPSGAKVAEVAAGATVYVTTSTAPANLEEAIAGGYALSATLTVPETVDGTIALVDSNGNEATGATSTYENGVRSFTGTAPANPTYTGSAWWWDYEFDGSKASIGSDTEAMTLEGNGTSYTAADATGNQELYFQKTPWRDATFTTLSAMTAVMYCQPGNYANTVLVGFGSTRADAGSQTAIALVTGDNPANGDMKLVLVTGASQAVTPLATLKAVDATTKKHLYAFVMDRITEDETEKTRVRVYLDGKVKAIYKHSGVLTIGNGFQIGSFHGGVGSSGLTKYNTANNGAAETANSGTLDFLRVFNGSLSDSAMAALADAYKYESAHGEATRDAVSAAASWVATDVWTQTVPEQADAVRDAPNADTNVTLSKGGSSNVAVELNLASDSNYESLTLTKEAGASGTLKLVSGYDNQTSGKLVAAATSILVDTVIPAGRANLGITSIGDGVTLTVDPYSVMGNYAILSKLEQLGPGGVFEDIVISMAILGKGASVVLDSTGESDLAQYGFTAELTHNESNQSYTFRVARSAEVDVDVTISQTGTTWKANDVGMPVQTEMPSTYTGTVTIYNISGSAATVDTTFAGGNLVVAASKTVNDNSVNTSSVTLTGAIATSGTVTFDGSTEISGSGTFPGTFAVNADASVTGAATLSGIVTIASAKTLTINAGENAVSASGTIGGSGTLNIASGSTLSLSGDGAVSATLAGSGRLLLASTLSSALNFGDWTGTVELPIVDSTPQYGFRLDYYGITGSSVEINNGFNAWLNTSEANARQVKPTLIINSAFTVNGTSAFWYNFSKITGSASGVLTISQTDAPSGFDILEMEDYKGSIVNNDNDSTPVTLYIGKINLDSAPVGGQKLVSTTTPGTVEIKNDDGFGVYVDDAKQAVTFTNKDDGIYVGSAAATTGEGAEAVTMVTTDSSTTSVSVELDNDYSGKIALPGNVTSLTVTGGVAINANQLQLVTTQGTYDGILSLSGTTVALDGTKSVTFNEGTENKETVSVTPAVAASEPMTMAGVTTAPAFNIKTIPGLYYAVKSGTSLNDLSAVSASQEATTTTTEIAGTELGNAETVRYYQISVGRTADEAQQ